MFILMANLAIILLINAILVFANGEMPISNSSTAISGHVH